MSAGNSTDPQSSVGGIPAIIRLQDAAGNVISDAHPLPVAAAVTAETAFEATAAPPTYTEGQNAPGSQDLSGNLRVRLPLVGSTKVSGIQEVHTLSTESANFSVTAGSLYFTLLFSSDFTGTVNTVTWDITTKPNPLPVNAQPGNTLPAYAVVVTTGSVFVAQSRPA